jgi:hypothetical protein
MATEFAEAYTNCQPVQARVIDTLQAEIRGVSSHSLPSQLRSFVEVKREMALDHTVCHFHPGAPTQDDGNPTEQLPHLSNRYRRHLGAQVGLGGPRLEVAKNDRNAQFRLPVPKKKALQIFWKEFHAMEVVNSLVADVNQPGTDVERRVDPELVMKWAGQEPTVAHRVFYDEATPELYGDLIPSESQRGFKHPVLHPTLAIELLLAHLATAEEGEQKEAALEKEGNEKPLEGNEKPHEGSEKLLEAHSP